MKVPDPMHACPFCGSYHTKTIFDCKDYTVTGEHFSIASCKDCSGLFTLNVPSVQEIGRYYQSDAYISHTDSHEGIFNRIYQIIRNHTIRQKRKFVIRKASHATGTVLDYGCGTGHFLASMKKAGWQIRGMEPDPQASKKAEKVTGEFIHSPEEITTLPSSTFDVITMWHVLEHIHDLHETLEAFKRLLKPDGVMIVAVPNHRSFDAQFYQQNWAAYDVPRHLYHFNPESIAKLMSSHGFKLNDIHPMWFDAFYVSLLSEKYKSGRMGFIKPLTIGLLSNLKALFRKGTCSSQIYSFTLAGQS